MSESSSRSTDFLRDTQHGQLTLQQNFLSSFSCASIHQGQQQAFYTPLLRGGERLTAPDEPGQFDTGNTPRGDEHLRGISTAKCSLVAKYWGLISGSLWNSPNSPIWPCCPCLSSSSPVTWSDSSDWTFSPSSRYSPAFLRPLNNSGSGRDRLQGFPDSSEQSGPSEHRPPSRSPVGGQPRSRTMAPCSSLRRCSLPCRVRV